MKLIKGALPVKWGRKELETSGLLGASAYRVVDWLVDIRRKFGISQKPNNLPNGVSFNGFWGVGIMTIW
jgi:hypothetical protein